MPRHRLKLLILLTAFAVAPASAGSRAPMLSPTPAVAGWSDDSVACPHERARLAAARHAAARNGPTTITLTDRVPADAPLLGRGSAFINP
jgi:uncharacterized membrane-anchored protein